MKIKLYIYSILSVLLFTTLFSSCNSDELIDGGSGKNTDGKVKLVISVPVQDVVQTRASGSYIAEVKNFFIVSKQQDGSGTILMKSSNLSWNEKTESDGYYNTTQVELDAETSGELWVVANPLSFSKNVGELYTMPESPYEPFNLNSTSPLMIAKFEGDGMLKSATLIPPSVKVSFRLDNQSKDYRVVVNSVKVYNVPTCYKFENTPYSLTKDGKKTTITLSYNSGSYSAFILENCQGELPSKGQQGKVPQTEEQKESFTYIEIQARKSLNYDDMCDEKPIVYRLLLGEDVIKDCNVKRNTHYDVTLTLTGNCEGEGETWRVETNKKDLGARFTRDARVFPADELLRVNNRSSITLDSYTSTYRMTICVPESGIYKLVPSFNSSNPSPEDLEFAKDKTQVFAKYGFALVGDLGQDDLLDLKLENLKTYDQSLYFKQMNWFTYAKHEMSDPNAVAQSKTFEYYVYLCDNDGNVITCNNLNEGNYLGTYPGRLTVQQYPPLVFGKAKQDGDNYVIDDTQTFYYLERFKLPGRWEEDAPKGSGRRVFAKEKGADFNAAYGSPDWDIFISFVSKTPELKTDAYYAFNSNGTLWTDSRATGEKIFDEPLKNDGYINRAYWKVIK